MEALASGEPANRPWLVIRHVEQEHIGTMAATFERLGLDYRYLDVYRGEPVPENFTGQGGLIVMGGPMGVYEADRYPFLAAEMRLIQKAAQASMPVLGICLGSQLIAGALGSRVYAGSQKEIGWYPIEVVAPQDDLLLELPSHFLALHWHGDTFDLPPGAVRLFRSQLYENQGFRFGRNIYGFQFHFEVTAAMIADWLQDKGCQTEIAAVPGLRAGSILADTQQHVAQLERLSEQVFTRFLSQSRAR